MRPAPIPIEIIVAKDQRAIEIIRLDTGENIASITPIRWAKRLHDRRPGERVKFTVHRTDEKGDRKIERLPDGDLIIVETLLRCRVERRVERR